MLTIISVLSTTAQQPIAREKIVIITGARFTYPLVQHWIDSYNHVNSDIQLVIESRGSSDPSSYDILIEAYEPSEETKKNREHIFIARYPVLPVANAKSELAKTFGNNGLDRTILKQLFFYDLFSSEENSKKITSPYTVYTRLQKAGVPTTFSEHFGYRQKDIAGKVIAGSDEHLLKAVLRDTTAVSYFPLTLIYDHTNHGLKEGLTVLPVDLNNNGKVSEDEKVYSNLQQVVTLLESKKASELNNIPVGYIHFSVDKKNPSEEALRFLQWVIQNGLTDLHNFGYLQPEADRFEKEKLEKFITSLIEQ